MRAHGLQSGDFMMVYKDGQSERFVSIFLHDFGSLLEIYFKSLRCINGGIHCVFVFSKGIRARKASSQVTGPQHELNRSRNYYADLTALNGTCFPPENVLYNFR